jgi:hypothetical protein
LYEFDFGLPVWHMSSYMIMNGTLQILKMAEPPKKEKEKERKGKEKKRNESCHIYSLNVEI